MKKLKCFICKNNFKYTEMQPFDRMVPYDDRLVCKKCNSLKTKKSFRSRYGIDYTDSLKDEEV